MPRKNVRPVKMGSKKKSRGGRKPTDSRKMGGKRRN